MAWTRQWQVGAELRTVAEWNTQSNLYGSNTPTISSTKARTGTYSVAFASSSQSPGANFTPAVMARASAFLNHNGVVSFSSDNAASANIFRWTTPATQLNWVRWGAVTDTIQLAVANTLHDSIASGSSGFSTINTWYHVGVVVFADATTGWVSFYVDGVKLLSVTGINTSTAISSLFFGGSGGTNISAGWSSACYFDDFYVDTSTVEELDEAPPPRRFLWSIADGNGANSDFTGNDGDSTDNYLLVDDGVPDGDSTYVYAQADNLKDTYTTANIAVPAGYSIIAAIPTALTKRLGSTEAVKLLTYDGVTYNTSDDFTPGSSYAPAWGRFELQPDGVTAWDETAFNASEFGIESSGTY
jgi:hypothetical protein